MANFNPTNWSRPMMIQTLNKDLKIVLLSALVLLTSSCSDSGGGSDPAPITSSPAAAPAAAADTPPAISDAPTTLLSGIAAIGAALDGATVEIIDASGNLVDIPDTLTGSDGAYQVTLPADVVLPVIVRITPLVGEPLLNVVQEPEAGTTEIVANVNPITNLVAEAVLGDVDSTNASDLASSLATVDVTTLDATSDAIVEKVLGSSVSYDSFATDPDFIANDGTSSGSAADAILDTIAKNADDNGLSLNEQLTSFAAQDEPPKLLEDPVFQVILVSELIQGGTDSADLESGLAASGAIDAAVQGEADIFRTIIETVPVIIESTVSSAAGLAENSELLDIAVDAAVDLVANTVEQKIDQFFADTDDLVELLASPSFQATAVDVVAVTVLPVLITFVDDVDIADIQSGLESVVDNITDEAASVTSSFEYTGSSTDVSDLVAGFVEEQIAPATTLDRDALLGIQDGTTALSEVVTPVGDVTQVQEDIQDFSQANPDLVDGSIVDLIEEVPASNWDQASWDLFNWT
jgi:hypothetical protein